jgi:hypothetical protein
MNETHAHDDFVRGCMYVALGALVHKAHVCVWACTM